MKTSSHDTHQIYFERYLRSKMTDGEQQHFAERLANDEVLKLAFENYKLNRKEFLKELITEHDVGPKKSRLATYFYLTITLIGVAVALSFYLENRTLKEEINQDKRVIKKLVSYIPFIGKKLVNDTANIYLPPTDNKEIPSSIRKKLPEEKIVEAIPPVMLVDTVLVPIKKSYFDERINFYINEVDSGLTQAELINLVYNNSFRYDIKHKTKPVGVVILIDMEKGNTYKFDGYNLVITTTKLPDNVLLVREEGELIWLQPEDELILNADNQIHNY